MDNFRVLRPDSMDGDCVKVLNRPGNESSVTVKAADGCCMVKDQRPETLEVTEAMTKVRQDLVQAMCALSEKQAANANALEAVKDHPDALDALKQSIAETEAPLISAVETAQAAYGTVKDEWLEAWQKPAKITIWPEQVTGHRKIDLEPTEHQTPSRALMVKSRRFSGNAEFQANVFDLDRYETGKQGSPRYLTKSVSSRDKIGTMIAVVARETRTVWFIAITDKRATAQRRVAVFLGERKGFVLLKAAAIASIVVVCTDFAKGKAAEPPLAKNVALAKQSQVAREKREGDGKNRQRPPRRVDHRRTGDHAPPVGGDILAEAFQQAADEGVEIPGVEPAALEAPEKPLLDDETVRAVVEQVALVEAQPEQSEKDARAQRRAHKAHDKLGGEGRGRGGKGRRRAANDE